MWRIKYRRLVFTMLVMSLINNACSNSGHYSFSGGRGTKSNPYLIGTAKELDEIRNFTDKYFLQTADIDLSDYSAGEGWLPINDFEGKYDGNNYKITNLRINRPDEQRVGLFEYILGGTVTNLSLVDVDIIGLNIVGALSGSIYFNTTIENCNATGIIYSTNGHFVGGLIGSSWLSSISDCYADVNIYNAGNNIGGLVGYNRFGSLVKRSFAIGAIVDAGGMAGGLIGLNEEAFIENCYATGNISGAYDIGGLVGFSMGEKDAPSGIKNSYATGNVFASESHAGGLIGMSDGTTIYSCYWVKETTGQEVSSGSDYIFGKTSLQMKTETTFIEWDFNQTWEIKEGETYPSLRCRKP